MKSSFSLRRFGVISVFIRLRVRVCSGGSCDVMCSAMGTLAQCCSIRSETSSDSPGVIGMPENGPATETQDENAGFLYTLSAASYPVTASTLKAVAGVTGHFDRR